MARPNLKEKQKSSDKKNDIFYSLADPTHIENEVNFINSVHTKHNEDHESIWLISYSDLMTLLFAFFLMLFSFSKIDSAAFDQARKETSRVFGGKYQKPIKNLEADLKEQLKIEKSTDKAKFDEFEKGISITFKGSVFFDSGSTELREEGKKLLLRLMPKIKTAQKQFYVVVEGHTDDNPIKSKVLPSNWELSSLRASAVLRLFEENGFSKENLRAIGFAETLPILPNRDEAGKPIPENQNQNRRVVIKLIPATQSTTQ